MTDTDRIREAGRLAESADHFWPSNHAHYMPEPCAEILTEWLYPLAEGHLLVVARLEAAEAVARAAANYCAVYRPESGPLGDAMLSAIVVWEETE